MWFEFLFIIPLLVMGWLVDRATPVQTPYNAIRIYSHFILPIYGCEATVLMNKDDDDDPTSNVRENVTVT